MYTLTTLCQSLCLGPPLQAGNSLEQLNNSAGEVWRLMDGSCREVPETKVPAWVNMYVQDVAKRHVLAISTLAAANQRYIIVAGIYSNSQIARVLSQAHLNLLAQGRIPPSNNSPPPAMYAADSGKALQDFGRDGWTEFGSSVRDTAEGVLWLERSLKV